MNNQKNNFGQNQVKSQSIEKIAYIITLIIMVVIAVALVNSIKNNNSVQMSKMTAEELKAYADDEENGVTIPNNNTEEESNEPEQQMTGTVTAHFRKIDVTANGSVVPGEEIANPEIYTGNIGEEYETRRVQVTGYKSYDVDPINKIGNYINGNIDVTYLYQVDSDTVDVDNLNSVVTVTVLKGESLAGIENRVTIQTKDAETDENILTAKYSVTDENGNIIGNFDQVVNEIIAGCYTAVPVKHTYTVAQTAHPYGYRTMADNSISFSIQKVKDEGVDDSYHVEMLVNNKTNINVSFDDATNKIEVVFKNNKAPAPIKIEVEAQTKDKDTNEIIPNAIYKAMDGDDVILNDYAAEGKIHIVDYTISDDSQLGAETFTIEQVTAPNEYIANNNSVITATITTRYDEATNTYVASVESNAGGDTEVTFENNVLLVTFKNKHEIKKTNYKIIVETEDFYDSSKKLNATYSAKSRSENQSEDVGEDIVPIGDEDGDYRYEITDIEVGDVELERYTIKQLTVEDRYILNDTRATIVLNKRVNTTTNKYEVSLTDGSSEDISIVGNEIVVKIKNKKVPEKIRIPVYVEVKDKDTNEDIIGGKYNLEDKTGRIIASKEITNSDNQLSTIEIDSTDKIDLIIKQKESPENYIRIEDDIPLVINTKVDVTTNTYVPKVETSTHENVRYELRDDGLYIIVTNKHIPYNSDVKIFVRTKDNDGNLMTGATYRITEKVGSDYNDIAQIETTENKQLLNTIVIDNADEKAYRVEEVAAPDKYIKSADKVVLNLANFLNDKNNTYQTQITYGEYNSVEIERQQNEITLTFGNALSIQKSNLDVVVNTLDKNGNSITGARYKLMKADRTAIREATEETAGLLITTFEINNENENNYILVEETAPEGYIKFADDIPIKLKGKINITTQKYEAVLEKQYQENIVAKIEDDTLKITVINEKAPDVQNLKVYVITQNMSETPIIGATYQLLDSSKNEILKELTQEEKMQILDLEVKDEGISTYYIKQIAAPEGYITNENEIRFDLVRTLNTEENKYQTTIAESTYENVEFVLNGDEIDIIFRNEVVPPPLPVFDLQVTKRLTQVRVIRKGVIKTLNKAVDSEIMKVDIPAAQVDETELEIDFDIIIKNVGEVDGWVTELADLHPEDFELVDEKGKWVASEVSATTDKWANKGISPGGTLTVPVTMKWKLNSNNIGMRTNKAKILQYYNEYDLIDPTPDNEGEDGLLVTIKTGGISSWIGQVFGLIILAIAIVLVTKKLINSKETE